ncbi:MAG: hypothetical protein JSU00_05010 [Acidobacteria bacterium]|nr:hypothetical protein [Acidobacteriota bacterium]
MICPVPHRILATAVAALAVVSAFADLNGSYILPQDHAAIAYSTAPVTDRVAAIQAQLRTGKLKLKYDDRHGYLEPLLKALNIPIASQVLVFSKTSFQAPRISPRTARALYFSSDVYVGWVPGGDVVEIAAMDPRQGVIFYTMDQDAAAKPRIDRRDECLQCHASGGTLGVPGLIVRSVFVERSGMPLFNAGGFVTDHRSPLAERWGGWYVTGTHGAARHMGNVFAQDRDHPDRLDRESGANAASLKDRIDTANYLAPSSDIVALMVLEHQTRMLNLLTRVGWETRLALADQQAINRALGEPADTLGDSTRRRIDNAVEELVKYLLFAEEAPLESPIAGAADFAAAFQSQGPRDRQGRSLRDLDMTTRMFRHPCSYLIYSEAFDSLPPAALDRIYHRLHEILTGADRSATYKRLTSADRKAVLEILLDTKRTLPAEWRN